MRGAGPLRAFLDDEGVEAAIGEPGRQLLIWDSDAPGFCLRIHPSGAKAYCVRYVSRGELRWYTIGVPGRPWERPGRSRQGTRRPDRRRLRPRSRH